MRMFPRVFQTELEQVAEEMATVPGRMCNEEKQPTYVVRQTRF